MDLQFKSIPFEVKASAPDGSTFEGKASPFFNIDSYGEIVDNQAFNQDLPSFMADGFIGGLNHNWDAPIGKPMDGTMVMPDCLQIKGSVIDTSHGLDVRKMLKAGIVKKLSIGYRTMGDMMLNDAEEVASYWQGKGYTPNAQDIARSQNGARVLTRIKLFEVSPVTVPANDLATITAVKAAQEAAEKAFKASLGTEDETDSDQSPSVRAFEAYLRDAGLSRAKAREAIAKAKDLQWDAASDDAGTSEEAPDGAAATEEKQDDTAAPSDPPSEMPDADTETSAAPDPAPTPTESDPTIAPITLADDLLPETAAMRMALVRQLHKQFLEASARGANRLPLGR